MTTTATRLPPVVSVGRVDLCCPACRAPLRAGDAVWTCSACLARYPAVLGIPDLRGADAPPNDDVLVRALVEAFPSQTFEGLVTLRQRVAEDLPDDLRSAYDEYRRTVHARGRRLYAMFRARLDEHGIVPERGVALDLGCGVGASTLAMAGDFEWVIGVDPSLPDLLLARKALDEARVTHVTLAQAYAQLLPLADGVCDYASAQNVLEHVLDVDGALGEVARVLKQGGAFSADSRNRFDLFFPEPHVRLRFVGFVPHRWQAHYVRWRRGLGYPGTRLLAYDELRRALRQHLGPRTWVVFPQVEAYGSGQGFARLVRALEGVPGVSGIALRVFPTHLALGVKA